MSWHHDAGKALKCTDPYKRTCIVLNVLLVGFVTLAIFVLQPVVEEKGKTNTLPTWHHFCKLCGTQVWLLLFQDCIELIMPSDWSEMYFSSAS